MKMSIANHPIALEDIAIFERDFNIRLPDDYRAFLLQNNGGRPEEDWCFDFVEVGRTEVTGSCVSDFYALDPDEVMRWHDLRRARFAQIDSQKLPDGLLIIAVDPGGNYICMSVAEEDYGHVVFANHELEVSETGYHVVSPVADSFTDFLDMLYVDNDAE